MINSFTGKYSFLSNFYPCEIEYEGIVYPSSEHAYQAHKSNDLETRKYISTLETPGLAKKAGKLVDKRSGWEEVKFEVMRDILWTKFSDSDLKTKLVDTIDDELVEGNWWHDNIWGDCSCEKCKDIRGQNHLGITLMEIRIGLYGEKLVSDAIDNEILSQLKGNPPNLDFTFFQ